MLWLWSWLRYCRGVDLLRKRCRPSRAQTSRHQRRIHQALALMLLVARSRKTLRVRRTFVFVVLRVTGTNRVSSVTKSPGMGVHGFVPRQESIVLRKVVLSAFQMERWLKDRRALSIRNRADDAPLSRPTRSTGPPPRRGTAPPFGLSVAPAKSKTRGRLEPPPWMAAAALSREQAGQGARTREPPGAVAG